MDKVLHHMQRRNAAVVVEDVEFLSTNAAVVVHPLSQVLSLVLHHQAHGKVGPLGGAAGVAVFKPLLGAAADLRCPFWQLQLSSTWPPHRRHVSCKSHNMQLRIACHAKT